MNDERGRQGGPLVHGFVSVQFLFNFRFNARKWNEMNTTNAPFVHSCWNHQISFQFANWIEIDWLKSLVPCAASSIQLSFTECNEIELAPCRGSLAFIQLIHSLTVHSLIFISQFTSFIPSITLRELNAWSVVLPHLPFVHTTALSSLLVPRSALMGHFGTTH